MSELRKRYTGLGMWLEPGYYTAEQLKDILEAFEKMNKVAEDQLEKIDVPSPSK